MAPVNDNFASAEELIGTSGSTSGTTLDATHEGSEPTIQTANEQSVWYKYTPAATGMYTFTIPQASLVHVGDVGTTGTIRFMIFGPTVDTLAECTRANQIPIGFTDKSGSTTGGSDLALKVQLFVGNTYYLKAMTNANSAVSNDSVVTFDLDWDFIDPGPTNDDFANAVTLSAPPSTATGYTTKDASSEDNEHQAWGLGHDQSVWFKFIPSSSGRYRFNIQNILADSDSGTRDMGISLYSGTTLAGLTQIDESITANDALTNLAVRTDLTSGTTYYIKVFSPNGSFNNFVTFDFDLNLIEIDTSGSAPANDDIANAEDLGINPEGIFPGTNISATPESWEISDGYNEPSTWYKFTIADTFTQTVTLTKEGTDPDWQPYAEIYTVLSDPPTDFTDLSFFQYLGDTVQTPTVASTDVDWVPGDYYMVVYNWNFDKSWDDYEIEFEEFVSPPPNDAFTNRIILSENYSVTVDGTTAGATVEVSEPNTNPGSINPPHPSVWYQWTSPNSENEPSDVQFDTEGSTAETFLEVFTGGSIGSLTLIDSDHNSGSGGTSLLTLSTNGGITYRIRVSSPSANVGEFTLNINVEPGGSPPANDDFANAELLTGFSDSVSGTTVGATGQYDDPFTESTNTVWYKWVPGRTGRVRLEFTAAGTGATVNVARTELGGAIGDLVNIEDFGITSTGGFGDWAYFSVETGYDYYYVVQGVGGAETTFDLQIDMADVDPPANDDPANATVLPISITLATINPTTEGADFDSVGPFTGDYVTESYESITVWYKWTATEHGNLIFTFNTETKFMSDGTHGFLQFYRGDTPESLSAITSIAPVAHPSDPFEVELEQIPGTTYWMAYETYGWTTASDIDYEFTFQDENHDGFQPEIANGTGDFDSVTGFFVADEEDNEWVASGGVGYGTISPWSDDMHFPYGWWCRFDLWSTSGDYLYRYGQSQQFIEIFRATKAGGDYYSLCVLGSKNGTQSFAVYKNGSLQNTLPYKCFGVNAQGTSEKVRVEVGYHGVTIDGRNMIQDMGPIFEDDGFRDSSTDQFVTFDFGIRTYPTDGTAYVDLDPEWNFRYSNIFMHDDPERGVIGPSDPNTNEVTLLHGFTTGDLLYTGVNGVELDRVIDPLNPPTVEVSSGDYSTDGYSLDCSVITTVGNDIRPCGLQWTRGGGIYNNKFTEPPVDTHYPGLSFRFYVAEFPTDELIIASISNGQAAASDEYNGTFFVLGDDGTLYIKPSYNSDLIPFCYIEEETWNYIELQADIHERLYATKIWLQDVYMGRFESTYNPGHSSSDLDRYPLGSHFLNSPAGWYHYKIGRLGDPEEMFSGDFSDITCSIEFRDIAITRHKQDRPLGPTIVLEKNLDGTGEHNYPDPDSFVANSTEIGFNSDFSGPADGAGQPQYWTGYDRGDDAFSDHPRPADAMYLAFLFQQFKDSFVSLAADGSGPPGHTGEAAMQIEAAEAGAQAAYVFGGEDQVPVELTYPYTQKDTLSAQLWVKGIAGQRISMEAISGIGGWVSYNSHVMTGDWERVRLYVIPQSTWPGSDGISSVALTFPDSSIGDIFLVKDFHLYINAEYNPPNFYQSIDDGATTIRVPFGDDDSWELIDEFPPTTDADQIYMNTDTLITMVRGGEDDGKTHLPPQWSDAYLEYTHETIGAEQELFGAKILMGIKGYNGMNTNNESVDFESFIQSGFVTICIANEDGSYRFAGTHEAKVASGDGIQTLYGVNLPVPAGNGQWTIDKWNDFRLRFGFHDDIDEGSTQIRSDWTNSGLVTGVTAQILVYDRRLFPPLCVRPVDLSRVRFRAWEQNEID